MAIAALVVVIFDFNNAISDALDCDYCKGKISGINFYDVGGDALDISGSDIIVSNIKVKSWVKIVHYMSSNSSQGN